MNNSEYVLAALRTESQYNDGVHDRFVEPNITAAFRSQLAHAITSGHTIDQFKKHFFYGKEIQTLWKGHYDPQIAARLRHNIRIVHAAIGLFTESTEILKALYEHIFNGAPLDWTNLVEEGGDQFWYLAILADALSVTFEDMQEQNIAKLHTRYPEKFTEQQAVERNLNAERKVLEYRRRSIVSMPADHQSTSGVGDDLLPQLFINEAKKYLQFCHTDLAEEATKCIINILQQHCGENGHNEGAVETLQRIICERDKLRIGLNNLTHQVEISNAVDDHGHNLSNLLALHEARKTLQDLEG
jgi:hypothetical protein